MQKSCVILDLDGTLCDNGHRVNFAKMGMWDEFHSGLTQDKPFSDVWHFLHHNMLRVIACTGRNERYRTQTMRWLSNHDVAVEALLMRPDDDFTKDYDMKIKLIEGFFGDKEAALKQIAFCLEDRDQVVEAFRNYGLPTWQVRMGEY